MKKSTLIRTVLLFAALVNQLLTVFDINPIPLSDETLSGFLSAGFTIVTGIWAWWKNNSFTTEAIIADQYLKELKSFGDK